MTVVNAGMAAAISGPSQAHVQGSNVRITDLTDNVGKIDLQGPMSAKVLMKVLQDPEKVLKDMAYFSFKGHFDANRTPRTRFWRTAHLFCSREPGTRANSVLKYSLTVNTS